MSKTSLIDRLALNMLLQENRKEEFYQLISEFIYEDGLNNYYLNMLKTAYNKWHKEVSNDY